LIDIPEANPMRKNPLMEVLIGSDIINTIRIETLDAYSDHGHPEQNLDQKVSEAYQEFDDLSSVGIDLGCSHTSTGR
jgi:transaldolase